MSKRSIDQLGELQRSVMRIVWEHGEATVKDVRDRLKRRKKPAYTTVLSVMQKLERFGWLRHRLEGRQYVYIPKQSIEQAGSMSLRRFIDSVFQGDPLLLFQHLIEDDNLTDEDVTRLQNMLDKKRAREHHDD